MKTSSSADVPSGIHPAAKKYENEQIGFLMERPIAVFSPEKTVGETIEALRPLVKEAFVTYGFVVLPDDTLVGVFTMRDLLFGDASATLESVMIRDVFALQASAPVLDAMRETLDKHYPVYPVCDGTRLVGLIRGQTLFEQQAIELSAQAGSMVGVEKEERTATPLRQSFFFRHPWLQLNLVTAFVAAAVVSLFEDTIGQVVALAVFLPVLAGQSGNTGCQAMAVALRGMTLNELKPGKELGIALKEAMLGFMNGAITGIVAGLAMFVFAAFFQQDDRAVMLGVVVFLAMIFSCVVSGVAGVLVPVILKRCGADPATASSIFLTTATDVVSMGAFLWLATLLVL